MPGIAIIGAQWGDEGKGKVTDALAQDADFVVRYQGGANAGHTVVAQGKTFKLNLLPTGVIHPQAINVLGDGMVIDAFRFAEEMERIRAEGLEPRVLVSQRAHLVLPHHKHVESRNDFVGTTRRGIGPAYSDRARRVGIRVGDLLSEAVLRERVETLLREKPNSTREAGWDTPQKALDDLYRMRDILAPHIADTGHLLREAIKHGKKVLFEGAQATMLDLNYGDYPYVTSSHPTVGGILVGAGVNHKAISKVYGVAKAYATRVGNGPFPTELFGKEDEYLRQKGGEFGVTTGRPRRTGWLDLVLLKYACEVNGFDGLVLTKLDVLSGFPVVKVGVEHRPDGSVRYEEIPGWGDLSGIGSRERLPKSVKHFIELIEDYTQTPVVMFSTSPRREDTFGAVSWV
ncbi:MAG: adenylosuccinate synthase [Meiothermus sp.]|uniref:adenylosuccinate synthase n=1 Tax=Meiothermus sp. TaxID=1955249 RepID=UPI0025EB61D2|nr:adenylosuccinate synthase [Meiothermus sp.]MCS7057483.1 adenylosuccinate synthase [Meiothermus sp.]MCS7195629.1 adenylosuccinate synthase [Meiothermus sp.]MCX7739758.1 adenylosuccinate synthase [Meiothermus sp.]MDW8091823.1 adenylosuccinate synthase [Meiothermus sp.]MDW8480914.1 adenylosuccinate synthase [Meiothermus sp.]